MKKSLENLTNEESKEKERGKIAICKTHEKDIMVKSRKKDEYKRSKPKTQDSLFTEIQIIF